MQEDIQLIIKARKLILENQTKRKMDITNNESHEEGEVAEAIENQTAKLPSDTFLWMAVSAMSVSAIMQIMGKRHTSLFIGQWVAPFLLFGVYNKIVKTQGND